MHHAFCTFLSRRCTTATWNFLISRTRFMQLVNTEQKFSFSFSKLRYGAFGFNPRELRQHLTNWMKMNKIDEVWNYANSLSKWRFWFVVIHKFLLPWQRDVMISRLSCHLIWSFNDWQSESLIATYWIGLHSWSAPTLCDWSYIFLTFIAFVIWNVFREFRLIGWLLNFTFLTEIKLWKCI